MLIDAVAKAGAPPPPGCPQQQSKRYSEQLSYHLAREVAHNLRGVGFKTVRPEKDGPGERPFQGGLGPKKLDVTHSDERNGLLLAISIKSITTGPNWGKNLTNRFADLCTESINMHMRFPYSVLGALFAFPAGADADTTRLRRESTFHRATRLMATISGRKEYTDPPEKFEDVTMMLFEPPVRGREGWVRLYDSRSSSIIGESEYYRRMREIFRQRNPHLLSEEMELPAPDEANEG